MSDKKETSELARDGHKTVDTVKSNEYLEAAFKPPADVTTEVADPFIAFSDAIIGSQITGDLLKFVQGEYLAGRNGDVVPLGTELACVMDYLKTGRIKWEQNRPVEHRMGLLAKGFTPSRRRDLGDLDQALWEIGSDGKLRDPWQLAAHLPMVDLRDVSKVYTFAVGSRGGFDAIGHVSRVYGRVRRQKPDCYPIIRLETGSYQHPDKQVGKVKIPILKVTGWLPKSRFDNAFAGAPELDDTLPPPTVAAKPVLF